MDQDMERMIGMFAGIMGVLMLSVMANSLLVSAGGDDGGGDDGGGDDGGGDTGDRTPIDIIWD